MKRINRQKVYERFHGHCAYCGEEIDYKDMQVDHFWPQMLKHLQPELDNDRIGNLMPSCRKCNNFKTGMKPEVFRQELQKQIERLKKNSQFDRALRFDQVAITEKPIVFYFEQVLKGGGDATDSKNI